MEDRRNAILKIYNTILPTMRDTVKVESPIPGPIDDCPENNPRGIILNTWNLYEQIKYCPPLGWEEVFKEAEESIKLITQHLNGMDAYYPNPQDVFNAFRLTPLQNVRVVIIGQDPYHQDFRGQPRAVGLSFSVHREDDIPVSLRNIYTEISSNYPKFKIPSHGDLSTWSKKGILLLNKALTVAPGAPGSHSKFWMSFTNIVVKAIARYQKDAIFLLWGNDAKAVNKILPDNIKRLEAAHPSGFSAYNGFFKCGHFKEVNRIITAQHRKCLPSLLESFHKQNRFDAVTLNVMMSMLDNCYYDELLEKITPFLIENDPLSNATLEWVRSAVQFVIDWSIPE